MEFDDFVDSGKNALTDLLPQVLRVLPGTSFGD